MAVSTNETRRDPRHLTNLGEILSCLSSYQSEEAELSASLTELLSDRDSITESLQLLQSLIPTLDDVHGESGLLVERVSSTAHTAERVGGRVKALDQEMGRISQAVDRVGQVMELKSSLMQLQAYIDTQDWESATRHCARAMSLPPQVISGPFAEAVVPTAENHLPPSQTLQAAREQLLSIFLRQFAHASRSRDAAATSRYFKLFPLIGWEAEGLEAYASFVVDLVRVRAPTSANTASPLYHVTVLTALFENVATIVDQHQPVVEKYYGKGKMQRVVEQLLEECDRVVQSILSSWREDRSIGKKLSAVASSPFALNTLRKQHPSNATNDEDGLNPREIDKILSEIAGMCGRWSLFRKFLVEQLQHKELSEDLAEVSPENEDPGSSTQFSEQVRLLEDSSSQKDFDELLSSCYIPLEIWYIRAIIEKAHRLSTCDFSQSPPVTTTPDDVFYMLKTVYIRLLSAGSLKTVESTTTILKEVMERDYAGGIKSKLDDTFRNSGSSSARPEKSERENRSSFVILLNDLDVSLSYMDRLTKDLLAHPTGTQLYLDAEHERVESAIMSLSGSTAKFAAILKTGIEQLFNQLMRAKLRTLIPDVYKDISYVLDENSYANAEHQDVVRKRFTKFWEGFADGYKDMCTESNYRVLFGLALDTALRPWEKHILTMHFSELGAVHFDRDLRSIIAYLSSQTTFGDVREKFVRLQQISLLLNFDNVRPPNMLHLDGEDVEVFYNGSGVPWRLSIQEAKDIVGLKV
ncbi:COG4 transport protein-domain-containing protein [Pisolithus marmoratus]|nr:COG4 transport protein-domain-containing protein [Pisolithus marmoratus]